MNKNKLKSYAPAARRDFIQAVTDRAHFFGLSDTHTIPVVESGDFAMIGGASFTRTVGAQREKLEARVKRDGFNQVMEVVAYTWFNRFLALRYMELHSYLEHGFRVLSNTGSSYVPEILDHAAQLDLPGLNKQKVIELKLDGSKDAELYRMLLVAQCNALHAAMPFLFEKIEDETELLLPDNLLHSDSIIRKLVTEIEEEDWQEVEIIGWLYQFYISEKKDQVIGKVVKSEDIPAATQLFTPNWIVKYLVQNSLGRKWLATYPESPLKAKLEYYIEPAEQNPEVDVQLDAITPASLKPEELTLLDPACGSGHILVEAYDIFKEIYLERGYSNRDFPRLILEKNLFGLDIDDRAAQMAGFALLMKARRDDRGILHRGNTIKLNVVAIKESGDFTVNGVDWGEHTDSLLELISLYKDAKTIGSLLQVPLHLTMRLSSIELTMKQLLAQEDLHSYQAVHNIMALIEQAKLMTKTYDCVVANPPYMGSKGMSDSLKAFAKNQYPNTKSDLFAMFIERGFSWCGLSGFNAMVTMQSWMFLSSFKEMRENIFSERTIITMAHLGPRAFGEITGEVVQTTSFVLYGTYINLYRPSFFRLVDGCEEHKKQSLKDGANRYNSTMQDNFKKIPGSPVAYWFSEAALASFQSAVGLSAISEAKSGMSSCDSASFLRLWFEVSHKKICFSAANHKEARASGLKWFPYNKGGGYRRWYGCNDYLINWHCDGNDIKQFVVNNPKDPDTTHWSRRLFNLESFFKEGISWPAVSSSSFSCRFIDKGVIPGTGSKSLYDLNCSYGNNYFLGLLNSTVASFYLTVLSPTLNFEASDVGKLPVISPNQETLKTIDSNVTNLIAYFKADWNYLEQSQGFSSLPWLPVESCRSNISDSWLEWKRLTDNNFMTAKKMEESNNVIFIEMYGLQAELIQDVPESSISLVRADRETDMKRLISYSIGCIMGRYSLDREGLVYADSNNINFDQSKYLSFLADDDGIVPIMDVDWFPDDAASRFEEFLKVAWPPETLEENLKFVADSLSPKGGETPRETIRRYISTQFYKDHIQTYKKRPIYWLFSSGKQRAFECLVYLHRYNEATLSRMRNEYVTPLQGKFFAQADYLDSEIKGGLSTAERNRLQKQLDTLKKKQIELASFDDLLRHYADQRICLDLDDGVKVNYGKFGTLLAEVKAVTGGNE